MELMKATVVRFVFVDDQMKKRDMVGVGNESVCVGVGVGGGELLICGVGWVGGGCCEWGWWVLTG